jgi:flavodoxin
MDTHNTQKSGTTSTTRSSMTARVIGFVVAAVIVIAAIVSFAVIRSRSSASPSSPSATSTSAPAGKSSARSTVKLGNGKILVVIFSSKNAIYGRTKPAKIGNTMRIADMIVADTGADKYEIVPAHDYTGPYQPIVDRAQKEQDSNARPAIKNPLPDVSQYSTVFVGSPVWWGEYPMVVRTFLDKEDLNGKTVIPFATSEGSGLGNFQEQLRQQYPKATIRDGFYAEGLQAAQAKPDVDHWLRGLGLMKH